ncbi:MAG: hypothetical protein OXI30_07770 [Chloroflexota bacterium]|nr:hypothetical protein [Chloroflexota bacterium]
MDIVRRKAQDPRLLDAVARAALGSATCGVSTGPDARIHLVSENMPEQQRASDVLHNFGMLQVTASATSLREDDADPVLTCADAQIAADLRLGYLVLRDGEEWKRGQLTVVDGACSLVLTPSSAADYIVLLYRLRGNFASASVEIRVDPA